MSAGRYRGRHTTGVGIALLITLASVVPSTVAMSIEARMARCATCHGADGNSTTANIPSIAGQPAIFLVTQLILFREGLRSSEQMSPEAAQLDDATIENLAAHYTALPPRPSELPGDAALLQRGLELARVGRCGQCHLPDFSGRAQIPRLAGQREDYLRATLIAYRDGLRGGADTTMNDVMHGAQDADIEALAHFLSRQTPRVQPR